MNIYKGLEDYCIVNYPVLLAFFLVMCTRNNRTNMEGLQSTSVKTIASETRFGIYGISMKT